MLSRRRVLSLSASAGFSWCAGAATALAQSSSDGAFPDGSLEIALTAAPRSTTLGGAVYPFQQWRYRELSDAAALHGVVGQTMQVRLNNELEVPTTLHWHGLRVSKGMDGVAGKFNSPLVQPGDSFVYDVPLRDPGTHWFHAHHDSLNQIARGLYGPLIVHDPHEPDLQELVLVLDDWTVAGSGPGDFTIDWGKLEPSLAWGHGGVKGRVLTVNGSVKPNLELAFRGATRLRMLNAATGRIFRPSFENAEVWVIAFDGFGCQPFRLDEPIFFGPGQRLDLLLQPGPSAAPKLFLGEALFGKGMAFEFRLGVDSSIPLAEALPTFHPYQPSELTPEPTASQSHELVMSEPYRDDPRGAGILDGVWRDWDAVVQGHNYWLFNDIADNSLGPLISGRVGETVEIKIANNSSAPHVIHFHGQHVQVRENTKTPHEIGSFRDSVTFEAWSSVNIAMKLDRPGLWPLHCHILGHQVSGMWSYYEVV